MKAGLVKDFEFRVVVEERQGFVVSAKCQPVGNADAQHVVPVTERIDLILLDVAVSFPEDLSWDILALIDLLAHLQEVLLRNLLLVLGVVQIGVQNQNGIGKSISSIARLQNSIGLALLAEVELRYCV